MNKPTGLVDKLGNDVYVGSILKVVLTISCKEFVGEVIEAPGGFEVSDGKVSYPISDCSLYGEVFRA